MKFTHFLIALGLLVFPVFGQGNQYYQIQSQTASGLIIAFDFGEANVSGISRERSNIKRFEIPNLTYNYENGKPLLPVLALPVTLPEGKISVNVTIEKSNSFGGSYPVIFHESSSADKNKAKPELRAFTENYPHQFYEIKDLGLYRDYRIAALRIYPFQVNGSGVVYYEKFKISISFPSLQTAPFSVNPSETDLLQKLIINKSQSRLVAPVKQQWQSQPLSPRGAVDYDSRLRLIVVEDGLYHVTATDLENANVDISQIIPSSFRLSNKGNDIALYLSGDQDNSFDPGDYIEFWGEENRKTFIDTYSDEYADPFSDENVYWLEWGGNPGLRMVEENGSLITTDPREYNPSPFYKYTAHIEENNHFERLGNANLDQLSYTRDLWFFDSGVKAVGRKQYSFDLIYPDSTSLFNPVYVDVMMSGRSPEGGHHVVAWMNDDVVGSSNPDWTGQDTSRITNRPNSTMKAIDLAHGANLFEIQLSTPAPSGFDYVLLNWFDVTYDRQYRAYQNYIEFTRPSLISFPNINLFQFDIEKFTRPDIEIYKKDISKIVNFDVEQDIIGNRTFYNASFQDNILSGDIEYVALTANRKKKPVRIERDKPFDPANPQRLLKDPANSADYVMITHSRFYDTALELRDYRRSQGIDVELVRVQDIYDEFNDGIKSPLAIKEFLKYVYRNWNQNHRLKYVLFFGDANIDYKSKSAVYIDYVPTFFYQSIEFGAVAADLPYSLVSGNDLIPDLFIGRIPVSTASQATAAIDKILEYEQNAPVGLWRNQALFLSGKDDASFEFGDPSRPIFRTQNSRILEDQLADNISSFRLNTQEDTSLKPDPNFGSTTDLIEYFDDGMFLVNFLGHGGGGVWSDAQLLLLSDINRLSNQGIYPFITSMTCFTGAFENPGEFGLAPKFMLTPDKGAIGVFASSGLGWAYNDFALLWSVSQFIFDRSLTTGQAITQGKIYYLSSRSNYYVNGNLIPTPQHQSGNYLGDDMVHQYNLIGDPYLKIARTPDNLNLTLDNNNPQAGDTLQVTIQSQFTPADGYVEIADKNNNIVNRLPVFTSSFSSTQALPIPANYLEGTGVVRAYLSDGTQDASGFTRIGVNYAAVDSIQVIPQNPDADDSVYVRFQVFDAQGIQRVYLLRQNDYGDTLFVQEIQPGVYQTIHPFPPTFEVGSVYYSIFVENNQGNKSVYRNRKYTVFDQRPDVFVYSNSIGFAGIERTQIQVYLGNLGGSVATNTPIYFYDGYQNFQNQAPFANGVINIQPGDSVALKLDFPLDLSRNNFRIYAQADPLNQIEDFKRQNNVDSSLIVPTIFNVTPDLGSTLSNTTSDTLSTDPAFRLFFPPGSVDRPTAVKVALKEFEPPADQPALTPVSIKTQSQFHGVQVKLLNPQTQLVSPFFLQMDLSADTLTGNDLKNIKLYERSSASQPWLFISSVTDSIHQKISANLSKGSFYAPFISTDEKVPHIELTVNGRPIQSRATISSKPVMYVVVEDESGLNFSKENINILMDGHMLSADKVFIPDSTKRNNILGITVYPELNQGDHRFSVQMSDVNGNVVNKEWELVVSDEYDVHIYGNYPNPFTNYTVFSYFVTREVLAEFEIRIYTVSGRLIKRITQDENTIHDTRGFGARNVGYNELMWDGTDESGVSVANGVYFALIRAKFQDDSEKEEILKVAKLR